MYESPGICVLLLSAQLIFFPSKLLLCLPFLIPLGCCFYYCSRSQMLCFRSRFTSRCNTTKICSLSLARKHRNAEDGSGGEREEPRYDVTNGTGVMGLTTAFYIRNWLGGGASPLPKYISSNLPFSEFGETYQQFKVSPYYYSNAVKSPAPCWGGDMMVVYVQHGRVRNVVQHM